MKIIETRHVEDCFDGSLIKELLLSDAIQKHHIQSLGKGGDIQYFPDFPRPFFKIRIPGLYDLKGLEGNRTMRIHFKSPGQYFLEHFAALLAGID